MGRLPAPGSIPISPSVEGRAGNVKAGDPAEAAQAKGPREAGDTLSPIVAENLVIASNDPNKCYTNHASTIAQVRKSSRPRPPSLLHLKEVLCIGSLRWQGFPTGIIS